ncbi:hypothetical protein BO94DRAFT_294715 [Aspergillus sclerotioniger CBS 115572]|uniref:C2H2-type domain-containing protein n=1 Tax=Aspergillus sclerotioniger CBS 115572 TaxID=1450535 RepID=A0A317V5Q5_9EURO|nr:hypothetical protein BO94DRAFT_294715 [Aspergillus sclerotioniger CBS 115572]PWY69644.1 hypothetical protein BO94DRAFT_294715 [Aspergillus sclerotioniger CBS 115572]
MSRYTNPLYPKDDRSLFTTSTAGQDMSINTTSENYLPPSVPAHHLENILSSRYPQPDLAMHYPVHTTGLGYPGNASAFNPPQQGPFLGPAEYINTTVPILESNPSNVVALHGDYTHGIPSGPGIIPSFQNRQALIVEIPREETHDLRCGWKDCPTKSPFSRWEDLSRHIKTIHVFPQFYVCPFCDKSFNRKDNLHEHMSRPHWRV